MDDGINMSFISSLSTSQKAHDAKPIETLGIYDPATVSESTKQSSEASIGSSTGWE
jgi:ribosomal protein S16